MRRFRGFTLVELLLDNFGVDNFGVMVPESSALVLLGIGAVALALAWRRRKRIS